jgi:hypothetical protein
LWRIPVHSDGRSTGADSGKQPPLPVVKD